MTADTGHRINRVLKIDRAVARRLNEHLTVALQGEAGALALRWRAQGRRIAPGSPVLEPDAERATEVLRAIDAIARSLVGDAHWQDDLIRAGWTV